jgi:hypothetical protein
MLRGKVFSRATACAGILGNVLLMVVEIILAIERRLPGVGMVMAAGGGLWMMTWYLLTGKRLLQLGASPNSKASIPSFEMPRATRAGTNHISYATKPGLAAWLHSRPLWATTATLISWRCPESVREVSVCKIKW